PFVQLGPLSLEFSVDRFTRACWWVFLQLVRFIAHGGSPMVFTGRTGKDAGCFAKRCKSFRPLASRRKESRSISALTPSPHVLALPPARISCETPRLRYRAGARFR